MCRAAQFCHPAPPTSSPSSPPTTLSLSLCLQTVSSPSTFSPPKSDPLFIFRFYFLPPKPTFAFSPHFGIHHVYHQPTTRKRTAPLTVLSRAIQLPVGSAALQPVMERERTILQRSKKNFTGSKFTMIRWVCFVRGDVGITASWSSHAPPPFHKHRAPSTC